MYHSLHQPYTSVRRPYYAKKGMVATSQPLAAEAGRDIMKKGGNAIDAAIATAATLTVVEPTSNGIGSDAFALVWTDGKMHGLNASGKSPSSISIESLRELGIEEVPSYGLLPVTVPGAPGAWVELSERFGRLPFKELLQPAIEHAEEGFAVSPIVAKYWKKAHQKFKEELTGLEYAAWFDTFTVNGHSPAAGEVWSSPGHANALRQIADTKGEAFYKGLLADEIDAFCKKHGGFLCKEDLENYKPEWVEPISTEYKDYRVWEIPPNGQGLAALLAANILKNFDLDRQPSVDNYHYAIEAMKLGFSDALKYVTDPEAMSMTAERLLTDQYAKDRSTAIGAEAITPQAGEPPQGGTVYLATADTEGNMVSFIQSNYMGFGSGIVIPDTGISLQNRGQAFTMNPDDDNALAPNKRTYHTIIPGFLTKGDKPVGPFGVMGGFMQPQGHLQVLMNTIDLGLNPQAALDAPRWQWLKDKTVEVEPHFPDHIAQALEQKGHHIRKAIDEAGFGRGQIIWHNEANNTLEGATESRADGHITTW